MRRISVGKRGRRDVQGPKVTSILKGTVVSGCGHFTQRMKRYPDVFSEATGEKLFEGTLNVDVGRTVKIREDFRISGANICEPTQDLLFEKCQINGIPAYRNQAVCPCDWRGWSWRPHS